MGSDLMKPSASAKNIAEKSVVEMKTHSYISSVVTFWFQL